MRSLFRVVAATLLPLLAAVVLAAAGVGSTPVLAQSEETQEQPAQSAAPEQPETDQPEEAVSSKDRKQQAKEKRIEEYLRKREERRAQKEMNRRAREAKQAEADAREIEKQQLATAEAAEREAQRAAAAAAEPPEAVAPTQKKAAKKLGGRRRAAGAPRLPRGLERAQANIRATELALDPTVQEYLVLIDQQGASAHELAAFGSFIAQNGMVRDALEYYNVALRLAGDDPVLWINAGTLHMQTKNLNAATNAFGRALAIDPNNAVAHYNMGAALDEMDRYDDAVAAYKTALSLDPSLGDPSYNPQAANNELLLAVRLMLYQEQGGSLAVPLLDVTTGRLPDAIVEDVEE